ncbi:hypothetical protein M231_00246 [Tremella mesenterica]|uniref:Nodulin-like domain-containing protein n=1 Tax=Tremella mesenterica TaxID=5217 RepID=A0A4Q1BX04_TREME|nr:hypothetical protein M231_00246 [Tremella mesenterica]
MSTSRSPPLPTVVYDTERGSLSALSDDSLLPPDIDKLLAEKKRRWYSSLRQFELPRRWQIGLTCLSITLSACQANGVYCWPTYGPVVAKQLSLTGSQAQTIVVGGILGVYIMAAPLGSLTDRYGVRVGSAVSAALAALGYLSFAVLLSTLEPGATYAHLWLTAAYFCVGAATVGSYFACLTCASLSFPSHPTLSLSVPLSLLGLSSLVLSSFSSLPIFSSSSELDPRKFLIFLGILSPSVNLFAALFMRVIPPSISSPNSPNLGPTSPLMQSFHGEFLSQSLHLDERTPLLIGGPDAALQEIEEVGREIKWTAWGLFKDWEGFWVFGLVLALCIGPSETIIASIGSILTSLLPSTTSFTPSSSISFLSQFTIFTQSSALSLRNKHVYILSFSGTISRLLTGFIADRLSPPLVAIPNPAYKPDGEPDSRSGSSSSDDIPPHLFVRQKPVIVSRSVYAGICGIFLAGVFAWSAGWLESERGLWVLSAGTGALYGSLFTLSPAIVSAHFGPTNFGLAWGMVSYFAALGSVLFSYLYAFISESQAEQLSPTQCYGPHCFRTTLYVSAICCVGSAIGFVFIGRRWNV